MKQKTERTHWGHLVDRLSWRRRHLTGGEVLGHLLGLLVQADWLWLCEAASSNPQMPARCQRKGKNRRQTCPFLPDKMMQVFVKGGVRIRMLPLFWYVHTPTCNNTHIQQLLVCWKHCVVYWWTLLSLSLSHPPPPSRGTLDNEDQTPVCKQQSRLTRLSVCVSALFCDCVWKKAKGESWDCLNEKERKRIFVNIFFLLSSSQFYSTHPSLVFARLCAPIDWQLAPEPLRPLKIPGRGFGFQAPASGPAIVCVWKAGSIRAFPSRPHSAWLLCVPPPLPSACYPRGRAGWGWQGVSADKLGRETGRQHTGPGASPGSQSQESFLSDAAHSSFVSNGVLLVTASQVAGKSV